MIADLSKSPQLAEYFGGYLPDRCFYCGDPFPRGAIVLWHGMVDCALLGLHAECAGRLALKLAHDSVNADHTNRGNKLPVGVDESLR